MAGNEGGPGSPPKLVYNIEQTAKGFQPSKLVAETHKAIKRRDGSSFPHEVLEGNRAQVPNARHGNEAKGPVENAKYDSKARLASCVRY